MPQWEHTHTHTCEGGGGLRGITVSRTKEKRWGGMGGGSEFLPILQKNKSNRGKVFVCEIQTAAECVTYRGGGGDAMGGVNRSTRCSLMLIMAFIININ